MRHHRRMAPPAPSSSSSSSSLTPILFLFLFLTYAPAAHSTQTPPPTATIVPSPPDDNYPSSPSFKPGIAVVVCVLTTIISLSSLLLLYIKHCNIATTETAAGNSTPWTVAPYGGRKNSGIERSVVESLPVFRFGALRGQKEGLDCAVCLMKFEAAEVLRLLPKCKHAFHVECVDTWLDAHSTCPLCRCRVDPEDILLVEAAERKNSDKEAVELEIVECGRRHSSVGERGRESTEEPGRWWSTAFRMSFDSATWKKRNESVGVGVGVGCFVRPRKDGLLVTQETERDRTSVERRLEHRIIVSPGPGVHQRWSDVQASDLLYLTSEMIMSDVQWNRRCRGGRQKGTRPTITNDNDGDETGILNSRSVSEITGLSRFSNPNSDTEGLVRRWLGWISKSRTQPTVR